MVRPILPLCLLSAILLPLGGCNRDNGLSLAGIGNQVAGSLGMVERHPGLPEYPQPALESLPPVVDPGPPPAPLPPLVARIAGAEAERLLADDPIALRFLLVHRLGESGLIAGADAAERIASNRGGLLPLTATQPPAAGLNRTVPQLDQVLARVKALGGARASGSAASERDFLADTILPLRPIVRQPLTPPDVISARRALTRLERLADTGLISEEERVVEARALEALIESNRLPQVLAPPAPPPPPPVKKPVKKQPHRGWKPEFVPNPPGIDPPKLEAGGKGPAGIHLLSMASAGNAENAWNALKQQFPDLAPLSYKVSKADLGELGVTYRLIAGPLDAAAAEKLCGTLRGQAQTCVPTPFPQ